MCRLPCSELRLDGDALHAAHVGAQGFGDENGAIGLLVVFHNGDHGAANGEAGAVQGVDELGRSAGLAAEADIGAAGLEIGAVGAGGYFDPALLGG